jgi:hypothetical protein
MNRTDVEYVLHCVKNASELISQNESEKAKGLLLSAGLLLSEKLTSDNSDYAKCPRCGSDHTFLYRTCGACDWCDYVE